MGKEFNGLVYNNQYYIYGFKIPKELYSKIKHKCDMWYKESQKLQQENQQLKEIIDELNENKVYWVNKCANAETMLHEREIVLDEIREYIEKQIKFLCEIDGQNIPLNDSFKFCSMNELYQTGKYSGFKEVQEILDKVKE